MSDDPNIVVENELLRRGFTSIPNYIFGLPISSNAKLIYMALLSYAWTNSSCYPGLAKLCHDVSLSDKPVTKAIEELSNALLLEVRRRGQGKTNLYIIKDFVSSSNGSPVGRRISESRIGDSPNQESENLRIPNKVEKDSEEEKTVETHTHTNGRVGGVGVGSKFTLEECQKYAAHLHASGQGITNPGGYATSIYRSGEADALLQTFLTPLVQPESADTSRCADCRGTGFWYPKGVNQGVRKCRHEKLHDPPEPHSEGRSSVRLSTEEITERVSLIAELLESGYTLDQAKSQFASGMHPDDWQAIGEKFASLSGSNRNRAGTPNAAKAPARNHHKVLETALPMFPRVDS